MPNTYFQFKQFRISQEKSGLKVTTDACFFGALVAEEIREGRKAKRILDIGAGTGLLSLMLAQVAGQTNIEAIDINKNTVLEANENFNASPWSKGLNCIHTSLQEFKPRATYDLIICNPPFFGKSPKGKLSQRNLAIHNDHLTMEELSEGIDRLLSKDGSAWVLYPEWEMKAFIKWMEKVNLFPKNQTIVRNKAHAPIFRVITGFARSTVQSEKSEVLIRKEDGSYSSEFAKLVEAYYL